MALSCVVQLADKKLSGAVLVISCFVFLPGILSAQSPASATATRPNSDALYQQLRQQADNASFDGQVASVAGLVLRRDAAMFKFNNGEFYFLPAIEGRVTGAVFLGDVEMSVVPPI